MTTQHEQGLCQQTEEELQELSQDMKRITEAVETEQIIGRDVCYLIKIEHYIYISIGYGPLFIVLVVWVVNTV